MKDKFLKFMGHKNGSMIITFVCIIICLVLINYGQSKEINTLEEKIENQSNYIEELDQNILIHLGLKINLLNEKLINQEHFIEQLWNK